MDNLSTKFNKAGKNITRYALAFVLIWVGSLKFFAYEAELIQGLVSNSPFMFWMYDLASVTAVAAFVGIVDITAGVLIALRSFNARLSAIGSLLAVFIFALTSTFILSTPGIAQANVGLPALSFTGQFLFKDLILLGAAVWTAGEALSAVKEESQ